MYKTRKFNYYSSFTDYLNTNNILKEDIINISVFIDSDGKEHILLVYWDNESED